MHRFLREESHVFVDCVVGDVRVGGIIECDENIEEHDHDEECENIVEDYAEWGCEGIEAGEIWRLHDGVGHSLQDEECGLNITR